MDIEAGMMAAAMGEEGETDEDGNQNWFRVKVDKVVEVSSGKGGGRLDNIQK